VNVQQVIDSWTEHRHSLELSVPSYTGTSKVGVGLAVESMRRHTTDEGWQLFAGLEASGYTLAGRRLPPVDEVDVPRILEMTKPGIVVMQDKREWDLQARDFRDRQAQFIRPEALAGRPNIFKVTVLKDAHQRPEYHRQSAQEIDCHAWIIYYHPTIVKRLAPYVRAKHLIRTWHTVNADLCPKVISHLRHPPRGGVLISGALSRVYPLRSRLIQDRAQMPEMSVLRHPGYHMRGCETPDYLQRLATFKVSICTASIYGYALRKMIEATACGCIVVTDLPTDEVLPEIDENLVRIEPSTPTPEIAELLKRLLRDWNPERQRELAEKAKTFYDYRKMGMRLAADIEAMRAAHQSPATCSSSPSGIGAAGPPPLSPISVSSGAKVMNEEQALARMIAPGTPRAGKYRQGVIQIWVTRACDKACFGCTQGSNLAGNPGMITVEQFEQAVLSLWGYFGVIGVFGGNPAMHPKFDQLCAVLRQYVPFNQRGVWSNHPLGWGKEMRATFDPSISNLNVHLDQAAYDEFKRDWPESHVIGLTGDSRHSPPYVALQDVVPDEGKRWELISGCDINQHWSAMVCVFRGELRAFFCEIAGAMSMLHQNEKDWPDLGHPVKAEWWRQPMQDFAAQVRHHCHRCGIPLRGHGELAQAKDSEAKEQTSREHQTVVRPKRPGREVELVTVQEQLGQPLRLMTDYLGNAKR
jgi:hypothetical protein